MFGPADLSNVVETAGMSPEARYVVAHDKLVERLVDLLGSQVYEDAIVDLLDATTDAAYEDGYNDAITGNVV